MKGLTGGFARRGAGWKRRVEGGEACRVGGIGGL